MSYARNQQQEEAVGSGIVERLSNDIMQQLVEYEMQQKQKKLHESSEYHPQQQMIYQMR